MSELRNAFEELTEAYGALRRMVERGYLNYVGAPQASITRRRKLVASMRHQITHLHQRRRQRQRRRGLASGASTMASSDRRQAREHQVAVGDQRNPGQGDVGGEEDDPHLDRGAGQGHGQLRRLGPEHDPDAQQVDAADAVGLARIEADQPPAHDQAGDGRGSR